MEDDCGKTWVILKCFSNVYIVEMSSFSVHISPMHILDAVIVEELCGFGLLNGLDIGKSMGPDELHPGLLEELANFVAKLLRLFFKTVCDPGSITKRPE